MLRKGSMRSSENLEGPVRLRFGRRRPAARALVIARSTRLPVGSRPGRGPGTAAAATAVAAGADRAVEISLNDALGRNWLQAEYQGNGHSEIRLTFANRHNAAAAGGGRIRHDLRDGGPAQPNGRRARRRTSTCPPAGTRAAWLQCAATRSTNSLKDQPPIIFARTRCRCSRASFHPGGRKPRNQPRRHPDAPCCC